MDLVVSMHGPFIARPPRIDYEIPIVFLRLDEPLEVRPIYIFSRFHRSDSIL